MGGDSLVWIAHDSSQLGKPNLRERGSGLTFYRTCKLERAEGEERIILSTPCSLKNKTQFLLLFKLKNQQFWLEWSVPGNRSIHLSFLHLAARANPLKCINAHWIQLKMLHQVYKAHQELHPAFRGLISYYFHSSMLSLFQFITISFQTGDYR